MRIDTGGLDRGRAMFENAPKCAQCHAGPVDWSCDRCNKDLCAKCAKRDRLSQDTRPIVCPDCSGPGKGRANEVSPSAAGVERGNAAFGSAVENGGHLKTTKMEISRNGRGFGTVTEQECPNEAALRAKCVSVGAMTVDEAKTAKFFGSDKGVGFEIMRGREFVGVRCYGDCCYNSLNNSSKADFRKWKADYQAVLDKMRPLTAKMHELQDRHDLAPTSRGQEPKGPPEYVAVMRQIEALEKQEEQMLRDRPVELDNAATKFKAGDRVRTPSGESHGVVESVDSRYGTYTVKWAGNKLHGASRGIGETDETMELDNSFENADSPNDDCNVCGHPRSAHDGKRCSRCQGDSAGLAKHSFDEQGLRFKETAGGSLKIVRNGGESCPTCHHGLAGTTSVTLGRVCSDAGCRCADPSHAASDKQADPRRQNATDLYCKGCGENLGKDTECAKQAYCGTCGETTRNPRGSNENAVRLKVGDRVRMTKEKQDRSLWRGEDMTFRVVDVYEPGGQWDYQVQSEEQNKGSSQVKASEVVLANSVQNSGPCNCESSHCKGHDIMKGEACGNQAGQKKVTDLGPVCDACAEVYRKANPAWVNATEECPACKTQMVGSTDEPSLECPSCGALPVTVSQLNPLEDAGAGLERGISKYGSNEGGK